MAQRREQEAQTALDQARKAAAAQWEQEKQRLALLLQGRLGVLERVRQPKTIAQEKRLEKKLESIRQERFRESFEQLDARMEAAGQQIRKELSALALQALPLEERQGIQTQERVEQVSVSRWYKPWTWGKTREQTVTFSQAYRYYDVEAAAGQLERFLEENARRASQALEEAAGWEQLRRQLFQESLEALEGLPLEEGQLRALAQEAAGSLSFPPIRIGLQGLAEELERDFGREAAGEKMEQLQKRLAKAMGQGIQQLGEQAEHRRKETLPAGRRRRGVLAPAPFRRRGKGTGMAAKGADRAAAGNPSPSGRPGPFWA